MRDAWQEIAERETKLRPWGSALSDAAAHRIPAMPRIGRTRKLSRKPCEVCGEREFHCDCPEAA